MHHVHADDRQAVADSATETEQRRLGLARRFRRQQEFSHDSSPLAACLCGLLADWLERPEKNQECIDWLLTASQDCSSLSVPMLLMAGLHRDILGDDPGMRPLARYFPSVGGTRAVNAEEIGPVLHQVIWGHRERLAAFFRLTTVQTNETARGICWLLPVLYPAWPAMHLVELGCSAGLNLVADQRHYRLEEEKASSHGLEVGSGLPEQFTVSWSGDFVRPSRTSIPRILSRLGCDRSPFLLEHAEDELSLSSFVWGDQVRRLAMLRQGMAALHLAQQTAAPVRLFRADLPGDLPAFLEQRVGQGDARKAPVVVYSSYLTPYLPCKGAVLHRSLAKWARQQPHPVLCLQWEPLYQGPKAPVLGWLGWTADLWSNGDHRQWHLAWVHPHGASVRWLPGLASWADFWEQQQG